MKNFKPLFYILCLFFGLFLFFYGLKVLFKIGAFIAFLLIAGGVIFILLPAIHKKRNKKKLNDKLDKY